MQDEKRTAVYDEDLQVEAYRFNGIMQNFPNHFHEYYVIGFMESGRRKLSSKGKEYIIDSGDVLLLNPLDNHGCQQISADPMDWRCINISQDMMIKISSEITGFHFEPVFNTTVLKDSQIVERLRDLHSKIMEKKTEFDKEELFYFLIEDLVNKYAKPADDNSPETICTEIKRACEYMDEHYAESICLNDLCEITGLKKYTLLRYFVQQRGITPYQYLETIRVNEAKKLLEQGVPPVEAAMLTGFTDQSHFTRFFKNYIGLTPKFYKSIRSVQND